MGADVLNHLVGLFDVYQMDSHGQKREGAEKTTWKANINRMRNEIRKETRDEEAVL